MTTLIKTAEAWGSPDFEDVLKAELKRLDPGLLPLQQGLAQSSYVTDGEIGFVLLNASDDEDKITAKVGVFYAGIIAGSCCADDPTPVSEQAEYCELKLIIDKKTAVTTIALLNT